VGALLLVLVAAVVWIRLLHKQVDERTRQLKQEIADHEQTEASLARKTELLENEIEERKAIHTQLVEKQTSLQQEVEMRKQAQGEVERIHRELVSASRLAGMAEVATSVLHNVGNVLNSVNVLAASIAGLVERSKLPGVARVAALLQEHQSDLGRFMTQDENGRHIPSFLQRLGLHLGEEQKRLLEKTASLNENIQHIKEIVAMQQNYARIAGVWETVCVAEVVEDALRMCSGALQRDQIQVLRDFADLPPVTLDRHKVLQILFNLLDNARHACEPRNEGPRRITVRIRPQGTGRISVQVFDNGVGIPRENLERIFTQGFSTRKGGHGFGLHSSVLAAQDMGGSLKALSDGPGHGAIFTLELPTQPAKAAPMPSPAQPVAGVLPK
jgi:C4-dicarboxylate-specific signal transduction histidine kinase